MSKSPRLHDGCTLSDAARWLCKETTEEWTTEAVLARLAHEWTWQGSQAHRLTPDSLNVAISPGTELEDRLTERRETTTQWRMMAVGGAAIEALLESLLQFGEATDVALVDGLGTRWLCRSPLRSDCLRLSPSVIESLVPEFDRFVQSSAALRLVQEWEAATAAEGQQDHGSTTNQHLPGPVSDHSPTDSKLREPGRRVISTKTRRNTLTPVIEQAQQQCRNAWDVAEVWAMLSAMAEKKTHPLIGATEDGIQWRKDGDVAILSRKSLAERIRRKKERDTTR